MQHAAGSKVTETVTNPPPPSSSSPPPANHVPSTPCRTTCLDAASSAPGTPHTDPRSDTTEPLTPDHRYLGPRALFVSPQKSPAPKSPPPNIQAPRNTIDDIISAVACMGAEDSSSPCSSPQPPSSHPPHIQTPQEVKVKETPEARVMRRQLEQLRNTAAADKLKREHIVGGFMFYTFESRQDIEVSMT